MKRALLVAAAAIVAYYNALLDRYALDDYHYVLENPALTLRGIPALFWRAYESGGAAFYRPLSTATFALDRALFGTWAAGYHAVNLAWHIAACLAVLALLRRLFVGHDDAAVVGALLFAVHPIHTEAVTGIVGRMELCAALFGVLGISAQLKGRHALAASFALLALLGKESGLFCAPVAVLLDAWVSRDPRGALRRGAWFALPLTIYAALRLHALQGAELQQPDVIFHLTDGVGGFATALDVLGRYLRLLVLPTPLCADYSYPAIEPSTSLLASAPLRTLAILVMLVAASFSLRARLPALGLGLAVFGLALLPMSNLVVHLPVLMAERFLYAPSLGLAIALAGVYGLAERRRVARVIAGALVLAGIMLTLARNTDWDTPLSLWQDTVEKQPRSGLAHANLALACETVGDRACALRELHVAVKLNPYRGDFAEALNLLDPGAPRP